SLPGRGASAAHLLRSCVGRRSRRELLAARSIRQFRRSALESGVVIRKHVLSCHGGGGPKHKFCARRRNSDRREVTDGFRHADAHLRVRDAAVGMSALYGRNTTSVSATLTGPGGASLSGSRSDYVLGFGDLYPAASLKWNRDEHNFMVYATTGI